MNGIKTVKNRWAVLAGDERFELVDNEFAVNGTPLVKVTHVGVCGTDMGWWRAGSAHAGQVIGHEFAGIVEDPGTSSLKTGMRVSGYTQNIRSEFCGHCSKCLQGDFDHCENRTVFTWKGGDITHPGAYSRYTTWFPSSFFELPENVSNEEGALLEPMTVCRHAVSRAGLQRGDKVLILGGGIIGLGVTEWVRSLGAGFTAISEVVPSKREEIEKLDCCDRVLDGLDPGFGEILQEVSKGGFDVVFDCAGVGAAVNAALQYGYKKDVRDRKVMVSVALSRKDLLEIDYNRIVLREVTLRGTKGHFPEEFAETLRAVSEGRLNVKKYIAKRIPFSDLQNGFRELKESGGVTGKAVIVMD